MNASELIQGLARFLGTDYTLTVVALGTLLVGLAGGAAGAPAVLRKQGLAGDVISHAALPGIVLGHIVWLFLRPAGADNRSLLFMLVGAAVLGLVAMIVSNGIQATTTHGPDTTMAIVLALFFGGGLVALRAVQDAGLAGASGLEAFLFGSAAGMNAEDILVLFVILLTIIAGLVLFYPGLKAWIFDETWTRGMGLRGGLYSILLNLLIALAVVAGLQSVGVVLMVAMLIAPAVAARQFVRSFVPMIVLSAIIGGGCGLAGSLISARLGDVPTGPLIVLLLSGVAILSVLCAPHRGLIPRMLARRILGGDLLKGGKT